MNGLILNGSPHRSGDTSYITNRLKEKFNNIEFKELFLYEENIKSCIDCRYCWKNEGCNIKDSMEIIYKDDYDILVLASPIYMYNMTPAMFNVITRLNMYWSNKYFLKKEYNLKKKTGILILTGGGNGKPKHALEMAELTFKILNANFNINTNYVYSLHTNEINAKDDKNIDKMINNIKIN